MIFIVSSKKSEALGLGGKAAWAEILPKIPANFRVRADDQVYIDISGMSATEIKKVITLIRKQNSGGFLGIIDPKGAAEDPAAFFFDGASDYIGPKPVKNGLGKKRFDLAFSKTLELKKSNSLLQASKVMESGSAEDSADYGWAVRRKQKLPAGRFEGWKSVKSGTSAQFFFLFASISGKSDIRAMVGEKSYKNIKTRFCDMLLHYLRDANALLWMETEEQCLLLIPPRSANGKSAVEAVLKILINSRLIGIEKLGLSFPVDFTFAMHYGKTIYHSPGKTGSVISEPVNYIFHLGAKRAETGRLAVSADVPDEAIPEGLLDIFKPAGEFEGIPIRLSRRFK